MSSRYSNGGAHQRDLRTQLFAAPPRGVAMTPPSRSQSQSPYDPPSGNNAKYDESYLLSLESQNNDEIDSMAAKVKLLKNLGVRMGGEINKSIKMNDEIANSMEKGKLTLKRTWGQMVVMSQRAGITWRMWLSVFAIVGLWFFWVWIT